MVALRRWSTTSNREPIIPGQAQHSTNLRRLASRHQPTQLADHWSIVQRYEESSTRRSSPTHGQLRSSNHHPLQGSSQPPLARIQVPHTISNIAKDAKRVYPYAVSLMETVRTYSQTVTKLQENPEIAPLIAATYKKAQEQISKGEFPSLIRSSQKAELITFEC